MRSEHSGCFQYNAPDAWEPVLALFGHAPGLLEVCMLLLKNVDLYVPAPAGPTDILIAGGRIERVAPDLGVSELYC